MPARESDHVTGINGTVARAYRQSTAAYEARLPSMARRESVGAGWIPNGDIQRLVCGELYRYFKPFKPVDTIR